MRGAKKGIWVAVALCLTMAATWAQAGKKADVLDIAFNENLATLDYYDATDRRSVILSRHLYDTLLWYDLQSLEYKPLLASSFRFVSDTRIEFTLRRGIVFHDGTPFDADDVVFTINYMSSPDNTLQNKRVVDWIEKAEKLDDDHVAIVMKKPFPAALEYLSGSIPIYAGDYYQSMVNKKADYTPVGTGPYRFEEVVRLPQSNQIKKIVLTRNDKYFADSPKGMPQIGKLVFNIIPDVGYRLAGLRGKRLDWIWKVSDEDTAKLTADDSIQTVSQETMRIGYLQFKTADQLQADSPVKDERVRKAIAHAIDRQGILKKMTAGSAEVVNTPCFKTQFGCAGTQSPYAYNPDLAKRLLGEAGYPNGFDIDFYAYRDRSYANEIMADLKAVGITTRLHYLPYGECRDAVRTGKVDFCFMTWGSWSINDVSAITSYFFGGGPDDLAQDPMLHQWLKAADSSIDPKIRKENYAQAIDRIIEKVYWIPLWSYSYTYAFDRTLHFEPDVDEIPRFYKAFWE